MGTEACGCCQLFLYRRRVPAAKAETGGTHILSRHLQGNGIKPFSSSVPTTPREMGISSRSSAARSPPPLPPCARASPQPACTIRMRGPRLGGSWQAPPASTCRQGGGGKRELMIVGLGSGTAGVWHAPPAPTCMRGVGEGKGEHELGPGSGQPLHRSTTRESVNAPTTCIEWISNSSNGGRYTRSVPLGGTPASSWPSSTSGSPAEACVKARIYKRQALRSRRTRP